MVILMITIPMMITFNKSNNKNKNKYRNAILILLQRTKWIVMIAKNNNNDETLHNNIIKTIMKIMLLLQLSSSYNSSTFSPYNNKYLEGNKFWKFVRSSGLACRKV